MIVLDKEVSEGSDRHTIIYFLGINNSIAIMLRFLPELLHLLSLDEEAVAQELVDREGEAVVEHGLTVQDLLGGDELSGSMRSSGLYSMT